jgi:heme A synthase
LSIDPEAAIAAGRARRQRDKRIALAVRAGSLVVYLAVIALGSDDAGALAVMGLGAFNLGIEIWRARGREGVEWLQVHRTVALTLLVVTLWSIGVHVAHMIDDTTPVQSRYYLLLTGVSLMTGGVIFEHSGRRDDA